MTSKKFIEVLYFLKSKTNFFTFLETSTSLSNNLNGSSFGVPSIFVLEKLKNKNKNLVIPGHVLFLSLSETERKKSLGPGVSINSDRGLHKPKYNRLELSK